MTLIIPYLILGIALVIISYYGVTFLLKRWDKAQQRKAEQTASHFEEMFVFLRRKILVRLYIVLPLLLGIVGYFVNRTWWMALIFAVCGAFLPLW
ncbi:MAG: hypothetical protein KKH93_05755, partial [Candidatus Omnitrophica bacterium]|nr:hypothetical protein [Candidatus Omnitrophota bacterium]